MGGSPPRRRFRVWRYSTGRREHDPGQEYLCEWGCLRRAQLAVSGRHAPAANNVARRLFQRPLEPGRDEVLPADRRTGSPRPDGQPPCYGQAGTRHLTPETLKFLSEVAELALPATFARSRIMFSTTPTAYRSCAPVREEVRELIPEERVLHPCETLGHRSRLNLKP